MSWQKSWKELPERLRLASERLLDAQIENVPAVEIIRRYDTSDVFMYIDPPYLWDIRKKYLYPHEMKDEEHIELLKLLKDHPGKIMISGYEAEVYNEYLKGWRKESIAARAEGGAKRTETIWMNYDVGQMSLTFDEEKEV